MRTLRISLLPFQDIVEEFTSHGFIYGDDLHLKLIELSEHRLILSQGDPAILKTEDDTTAIIECEDGDYPLVLLPDMKPWLGFYIKNLPIIVGHTVPLTFR